VVGAAESEGKHVVDGERIAKPRRLATEPAVPLFREHLGMELLIGAGVATCRRALAPAVSLPLGSLGMDGAARPASRTAALDTGAQAAHFAGF
jgi:hypothetical protein